MKRHIHLVALLIALMASLAIGPAHADGSRIYVVRPGDTLTGIAARNGITATQLATANGIRWNDWVYVGQRLRIPTEGSPASASTGIASGVYVVRAGDTLVGIAGRHGVSVSQLAAANGIAANAWVYVGQRLKIPGSSSQSSASSSTGGTYVVRPGDSLGSIAARHGITVSQLARANGLHTSSWVYSGQRLRIPGSAGSSTTGSTSSSTSSSSASSAGTYTVRPGDTLIGIAVRHGVSVSQLAAANGLRTNSWVYSGQRLRIPGSTGSSTTGSTSSGASSPSTSSAGKWIDINLSTQTLTAYVGQTPVFRARVSTGTWRHPTVVGTFRVYVKYVSTRMRGPGYDLPNVPYTMYFYAGYGIHGTYWHNNFGTPMSHGCVNMRTADARWLFNWAPVGTKVVTHY
jgi:LysM repeat protein